MLLYTTGANGTAGEIRTPTPSLAYASEAYVSSSFTTAALKWRMAEDLHPSPHSRTDRVSTASQYACLVYHPWSPQECHHSSKCGTSSLTRHGTEFVSTPWGDKWVLPVVVATTYDAPFEDAGSLMAYGSVKWSRRQELHLHEPKLRRV